MWEVHYKTIEYVFGALYSSDLLANEKKTEIHCAEAFIVHYLHIT